MERTYNDLSDIEKKRAEEVLDMLQRIKNLDITKDDITLVKILLAHLETNQPKEDTKTEEKDLEESPAGKVNLSTIMSRDHLTTLYQYLNNNGENNTTELIPIYRATRDGDVNFHKH